MNCWSKNTRMVKCMMLEIKLKKRYPHIPIEDVTQIFNEGYLKGYENGLKTAIPIEWLEKCKDRYILCCTIIDDIIEEWREENGKV